MAKIDEKNITEGEVVEEKVTPVQQSSGEILINMEGMIKNHITVIGRLQEEIKKLKEMLDDIFESDPTFQEHKRLADEALKVKKITKKEILKRPQAHDLDEKIKSLRSQLKENQGSLSDYLGEYQRLSGVNEIEDERGEVHEIVYVAKLRRATR